MDRQEVRTLCDHTLVNILDLDTHTLYPCIALFNKANVGDYIDNVSKEDGLSYKGYVKRKVFRSIYGKNHIIIEISNKK